MRLVKKISLIIICVSIILWITSILTGYVIVIKTSPVLAEYTIENNLTKGDTVQPLKNVNFTKGDCRVYLITSIDDYKQLNNVIKKSTCLETEDFELINRIKNEWKFKYEGGDMVTVDSHIYFVQNGKIVFYSGIVLDKETEGLQSKTYGWLEPLSKNALSNCCKDFKKVYFPIVLL